jgi:hypothetical protein
MIVRMGNENQADDDDVIGKARQRRRIYCRIIPISLGNTRRKQGSGYMRRSGECIAYTQ